MPETIESDGNLNDVIKATNLVTDALSMIPDTTPEMADAVTAAIHERIQEMVKDHDEDYQAELRAYVDHLIEAQREINLREQADREAEGKYPMCQHGDDANVCMICLNERANNFERLTHNIPYDVLERIDNPTFERLAEAAEMDWEYDVCEILRDCGKEWEVPESEIVSWFPAGNTMEMLDDGEAIDVDSWLYDETLWPTEKKKPLSALPSTSYGGLATSDYGSYWEKCRHYQTPLAFPDEAITVYGSSCHSDRAKDPIPDLGIYLASWVPDTIAFHIGCPDWGIPKPKLWQVFHVAREGLRMAREGKRVEIGCIGGHGRTGLMMAVMILVNEFDQGRTFSGKEALNWVRQNYCKEAVESIEQEWYIDVVAAELAGEKWPEKPEIKLTTNSGSVLSQYTMLPEPCPECGHKYRHNEKKPCWVWSSIDHKECQCKHDHPPGWNTIASDSKTFGEMIPICGHSPKDEPHVTCELKVGHELAQPSHMVLKQDGTPFRKWEDWSRKSWYPTSSYPREGD